MSLEALALGGVALLAAAGNGALGYGLSSLTVPVALFFLTNRVLNPALVPITAAEFRAALGLIRLTEAAAPAAAYGLAGLFTRQRAGLMTPFVPAVIVGAPVGTALVRCVRPESFRRVCMSFERECPGRYYGARLASRISLTRRPNSCPLTELPGMSVFTRCTMTRSYAGITRM